MQSASVNFAVYNLNFIQTRVSPVSASPSALLLPKMAVNNDLAAWVVTLVVGVFSLFVGLATGAIYLWLRGPPRELSKLQIERERYEKAEREEKEKKEKEKEKEEEESVRSNEPVV